MKKYLQLLLLLIGLSPVCLFAWSTPFHRIGVQIAKENLSKQVIDKVNYYIKILSDAPPVYKDMVLAASWLDEIRQDIPYFSLYHYKSSVYNPDHFSCKVKSIPYDAVFALRKSIAVLKSNSTSDFAKALSLRILIHVALDIHQPLHAVQLCSAKFPTGDKGGNKFPVSVKTKTGKMITSNLHKFWDNVFYIPVRSRSKANNSKLQFLIRKDADALIHDVGYPVTDEVSLDPAVWAQESKSVAEKVAYNGIVPGQTLPVSYVEQAALIAKKRIVLGGIRLARLLKEIFKGSKTTKKPLSVKIKR